MQRSLVTFGREICGDLPAALRREWLVTNGLGGYASGTVAGAPTRRYHGLLVVSLTPPVERMVTCAGVLDEAAYLGQSFELATLEEAPAIFTVSGYRNIQSFTLDGMAPVWTFALVDALVERRIIMPRNSNASYLMYRVMRASAPVTLCISPLMTWRGFHDLQPTIFPDPPVSTEDGYIALQMAKDARMIYLWGQNLAFEQGANWVHHVILREETARGYSDHNELFIPGTFTASLQVGETCAVVISLDEASPVRSSDIIEAAHTYNHTLVQQAHAEACDPIVQQLVLAADQFIVTRGSVANHETTVLAGYHWFNDWGRDTMIALPGLTLATGRHREAASIIRTYAKFARDGLLPNNFPDRTDMEPGYNTADASLWFFNAIWAYVAATHDRSLADEIVPALRDIADCHLHGTIFGICVDPVDGLLRAGEPGLQLTWMDVKIDNHVVTPRIGKTVEINALWHNALSILSEFLAERDPAASMIYHAHAQRARNSFSQRFPRPDGDGLFDVVDGPDGDDPTIRPNQIFAVTLPFAMADGDLAKRIVREVARELLTSLGLRTLSAKDPAYIGTYAGDRATRDSAYHQGTVWAWLIGAFAEAVWRTTGDKAAALEALHPFAEHLRDAGLGTISEIFDGDPPHTPRGAIAQAWSVAGVLQAWRFLTS